MAEPRHHESEARLRHEDEERVRQSIKSLGWLATAKVLSTSKVTLQKLLDMGVTGPACERIAKLVERLPRLPGARFFRWGTDAKGRSMIQFHGEAGGHFVLAAHAGEGDCIGLEGRGPIRNVGPWKPMATLPMWARPKS